MALQVIGAGFGRTGTMSLKLALEQLGFAPCYHMVEVFRRPGEAQFWHRAALGETQHWETALAGYKAAVDWPCCHFWRELAAAYPQAKIILTERDPQAWYKSISQTILASLDREIDEAKAGADRVAQMKMIECLIREKTFSNGLDEAHVLAVYRAHNEAVKRDVPRERLLVFDAPDGWTPLCGFLDVAVPATPFPKTNSTEEFRARASL